MDSARLGLGDGERAIRSVMNIGKISFEAFNNSEVLMATLDQSIIDFIHDLDDRQRTTFVARCVCLLFQDEWYASPLMSRGASGEYVVTVLEELAKDSREPAILEKNVYSWQDELKSASWQQLELIHSEQKTQESLDGNEDEWIAAANVKRAEYGYTVINWLIDARRNEWKSANIPADLMEVLLGDRGNAMSQILASMNPTHPGLLIKIADLFAAANNFRGALELYLRVVESDKHGLGIQAKLSMVRTFECAGQQSELTREFRRRLTTALY